MENQKNLINIGGTPWYPLKSLNNDMFMVSKHVLHHIVVLESVLNLFFYSKETFSVFISISYDQNPPLCKQIKMEKIQVPPPSDLGTPLGFWYPPRILVPLLVSQIFF